MPSSTTSSEPVRVLLVDDNAAMLARVASVLSPACAIVAAVNDGRAALEAAARLQPDVIVLDIVMPEMTGFDVAAHLRAAGSTAHVVFLTVYADAELIAAARDLGGVGYVVKPRLASDLMDAVREAQAGRSFVSAPA